MVADKSVGSRALDLVIHTLLLLIILITLYPVLHVLSVSISSASAFRKGISFYPRELDFNAYRLIFKVGTVPRSLVMSILYTSTGTLVNMALTATLAFALSRKRLALRKLYTLYVMIPMFFSGGLIPSFLLVRQLGMYNTTWAMILPGGISVWNLIVLRTFFQSVPEELDESAYIDGANDLHIFARIILPVSKAGMATITLFYAVGHWNSWFQALIYLKDNSRYPLQMILRQIVIESQLASELAAAGEFASLDTVGSQVTESSIKYATICISMVPMLALYPFIQKHFVKGVMIGSIKG